MRTGDRRALRTAESGPGELRPVLFRTEPPAGLRGREGGRVDQDDIELPPFLRQAPQPVERIPVNEIVRGGIQLVQDQVPSAPVEVLA